MDAITQLDGKLLIGIQQALNADWLTPIMKVITAFGEYGIFWILVCLVLLAFKKTRRIGIICTLSLALTFILCNGIIKPLVDRERPFESFSAVQPFLPHPGDASFPSGHTANAMGPAWGMFIGSRDRYAPMGWQGAGVPARTVHKWSIAAIVLALLIGLSRMYLGMHYPSDVLAALLVGMISATVVCESIRKYESKRGIIGEHIKEED